MPSHPLPGMLGLLLPLLAARAGGPAPPPLPAGVDNPIAIAPNLRLG